MSPAVVLALEMRANLLPLGLHLQGRIEQLMPHGCESTNMPYVPRSELHLEQSAISAFFDDKSFHFARKLHSFAAFWALTHGRPHVSVPTLCQVPVTIFASRICWRLSLMRRRKSPVCSPGRGPMGTIANPLRRPGTDASSVSRSA